MEQIKKLLGNASIFVVGYLIFMLPTYYLPFAGSNSSIAHVIDTANRTSALNFAFGLHFGSMLVLCFLCWLRGAHIGKRWLLVFPVLAIVFDFVPGLSLIPLIPTVMHLLAIILGAVTAQTGASTTAQTQ